MGIPSFIKEHHHEITPEFRPALPAVPGGPARRRHDLEEHGHPGRPADGQGTELQRLRLQGGEPLPPAKLAGPAGRHQERRHHRL
ncbi:hypothetical protein D3C75_1019440 [compost metagenome]